MSREPRVAGSPAAASPVRLHALARLWHAHQTAREVASPAWEFACQLSALRAEGVSDTDLRWLLKRGYAEHLIEITAPRQRRRRFRPATNSSFHIHSCFLLTADGCDLARTLKLDWTLHAGHVQAAPLSLANHLEARRQPRWDAERRMLWLGNMLVKRFRLEAKSQELILAAFEEEGWPTHLDDPLPPRADVDSRRRLHDTIKRLNRHQEHQLIRFHGDGSGRGIRWVLTQSDPHLNGPTAAPTRP